ncbi:MAG TPA: diguanylate cyclase [Gaiellaceae bacterium]|nr:diguanylate cyclase [Gaiellaceae bacterium]
MIGSFKFKLVATFLALSLLPLAVAYWTFSGVADRSVTSTVDARLEAGLRAAVAAYEDEQAEAEQAARQLARDPTFQAALGRRDRGVLQPLLDATPNLRVQTANGFSVGRIPEGPVAESTVTLLGPGARSATVVAAIPLGEAFVARLRQRSGLRPPDALVLVENGRVRASSQEGLRGAVDVPSRRAGTTTVGDATYRVVGVQIVPERPVQLVAATSATAIAAEQSSVRNRILGALAASLLLIAMVAYIAGRSIVGALARLAAAANSIAAGRLRERVPVRGRDEFAALGLAFNRMAGELEARVHDLEAERRRLRDANTRFGEALAATLDADQLRRVIVASAVEATHADGGRLHSDGTVVELGDAEAGPGRLEFELSSGRGSFGTLVLFGREFDQEATLTAASLAGQAVVALENARLHRIVEQQALVDVLTELANRRQAEEWLGAELSRAERLGGSVGLILADLDDFKAINDRHGHLAGDAVLRDVAEAFRETVREIDLPARWGGEEFAVVLPGADLEGAAQVAERLREAIAELRIRSAGGASLAVTASFGVASASGASSLAELLEGADDALYRAKRAGKNRVYAGAEPVARH